jgi:hypothetical protein
MVWLRCAFVELEGYQVVKTLIFAVAGYNLAETGRMLEIAKACKGKFEIIFASYGGQYEHFIEEAGFELKKMEPRLTQKRLDRLRVVLSGETLNTVGYLTEKELLVRVPNEIEFFKEVKPAAVLTGWCLSVTISTRAANVPFVNGLHSTSITEYYEAGLQTWPDRLDFAFLRRLFGKEKLQKRFNKRILNAKWVLKPYNTIGKRYGLTFLRAYRRRPYSACGHSRMGKPARNSSQSPFHRAFAVQK